MRSYCQAIVGHPYQFQTSAVAISARLMEFISPCFRIGVSNDVRGTAPY